MQDKKTLVATDIFGTSRAFNSLLQNMGISNNTVVVSPYPKGETYFENEQQAYRCFQEHGGIDGYISKLADVMLSETHIGQVIGFSAGGAALYKVMSDVAFENVPLVLFYPGQIRYFMDKQPKSPCHIIFPEFESHFSVLDVISELQNKALLNIEQSKYPHGFMNSDSKGFNKMAYMHYCQMVKQQFV